MRDLMIFMLGGVDGAGAGVYLCVVPDPKWKFQEEGTEL